MPEGLWMKKILTTLRRAWFRCRMLELSLFQRDCSRCMLGLLDGWPGRFILLLVANLQANSEVLLVRRT